MNVESPGHIVGTGSEVAPSARRSGIKEALKGALRGVVPLALRKRLAIWLDRQGWLPSGRWWAVQLLQDLAERDVNAYHRFLWANHMAYAETYEIDQRFGVERINETRHMVFADLERLLRESGLDPQRDVRSVFEVGCSLGYLLSYLEHGLFRGAQRIEGIDIDRKAIEEGRRFLAHRASRVRLHCGDMGELASVFAGASYDVMLCFGVLMYVREETAQRVVAEMLAHTDRVLAITALAHPEIDNRELDRVEVRERDGTFIYNVDAMVERAGGEVLCRRWEGSRIVDGNTIYFLLCRRRGGKELS